MVSSALETMFTRDLFGMYSCNTFAQARDSGPFDVVIVGGGTFGLVLAQDLFFRAKRAGAGTTPADLLKPPNLRVLVLEAGPFVLPEHTQDVPNLRLRTPQTIREVVGTPLPDSGADPPTADNPLPATRQQLVGLGLAGQPRPLLETWGLPWNSAVRFGGLAYCLGGRSLYWGGWSPHYLDTEMPTAPVGAITAQTLWPQSVVQDLQTRFLLEAAEQTGVSTSNDFIDGPLHRFYREQLFAGYGAVPFAVPLNEIQNYAVIDPGPRVQAQRAAPPIPQPGFDESLKLDAPLAVQAWARPGFFTFDKFSSVPLAFAAARDAVAESGLNNDGAKRLMIVPNCHVKGLTTRSYTLATGARVDEVVGIDTSDGFLDLSGSVAGNPNRWPVVVLAMGAIESARTAALLAASSASGIPANEFGTNLMVHVRKNAPFTIPLPGGLALADPQVSALLVRCRDNINVNGNPTPVHFHFQIAASAVGAGVGNSQAEALLFQMVPDLDTLRFLEQPPAGQVNVVIRAVGEMLPTRAGNLGTVTVPQPTDNDEFVVPRASVALSRGPEDGALQVKMDQVIRHLAGTLFGHPNPAAINIQLDGLGTTFHESGTLRMGDNPTQSVVNADGQFHRVTNLYAGDAAVLPTCGSANPVMNGVALRRRLAKRIVPEGDGSIRPIAAFYQPAMPAAPPAAGTVLQLFDGVAPSLANWRMAGRGTFHAIDGALQSVPSFDLGLLWCIEPMPQDYRLELEFLIRTNQTNSGVFLRFRNPDALGYYNPAWSAVDTGFEVQIDNVGAAPAGQPQSLAKHRTGAVYGVNYPGDPNPDPNLPLATPGDSVNPQNALLNAWNQYRIEVQGNVITVQLNGAPTARYTNNQLNRGQFLPAEPTFIGLQSYSNYGDTTAFRNIRVTVL